MGSAGDRRSGQVWRIGRIGGKDRRKEECVGVEKKWGELADWELGKWEKWGELGAAGLRKNLRRMVGLVSRG